MVSKFRYRHSFLNGVKKIRKMPKYFFFFFKFTISFGLTCILILCYISFNYGKVINETLRIASSKTIFLKDTNTPYNINGYTIPKGWTFFAMLWNIHMDPDIYVKPEEFNPSRWDDLETKPGCFLPFSIGPRMCPGSNLARLEISVILRYFLLYYRLEQFNPDIKTDPPENCLVRFKKLSA